MEARLKEPVRHHRHGVTDIYNGVADLRLNKQPFLRAHWEHLQTWLLGEENRETTEIGVGRLRRTSLLDWLRVILEHAQETG